MSAVSDGSRVQPLALGDELAGAQDELVAGHAASLGLAAGRAGRLTPMANLSPHDVAVLDLARRSSATGSRRTTTPPTERWVGHPAEGVRAADDHLAGARRRGAVRRLDRRRPQAGRGRLGASGSRPGATGSNWSARNVGRVEALRAEGRMRPAGEAAYARRREDRTAIYSFERQLGASTTRPKAALRRTRTARGRSGRRSRPGYRRLATHWVMSAKRPETRAKRLAQLWSRRAHEASAWRSSRDGRRAETSGAQPPTMNPSRSARARSVHGPGPPVADRRCR